MGEMRDMFFCALVYLFLFTVQSSQELKARIKPNKTDFFFESGIKLTENVTCESDCGIFNWSCTYMWLKYTTKFGKEHGDTYIKENKSIIGTPPTENVTIRCLVTFNKEYSYSEEINLFMIEKISLTTTPFFDDKNASNSRKNETEVTRYTTVILESSVNELTKNISDILPRSVSCTVDCNLPECDSNITVKRNSQFYRTIHSRDVIFENRAAKDSDDGTYVCMVGSRMSENNFTLIIHHGPRTVSVLRKNDPVSVDIIEKEDTSMTIPLNCSSNCNPPCEATWYKDGQLEVRNNPVINITLDRRKSGVYQCEASGVQGKLNSTEVNITIQYAPRNITIRSYGDIDDLQEGPGYIEISCNADCNPECDRYQIYHNGAIINTSKHTNIKKDRKNSGRYQCAATNSISDRFQNSTNSVDIDIKYAPSNVSIQYWSDSKELREGHGSIEIRCNADCNPECDRYKIYHNSRLVYASKHTNITKDRKNSGRYQCAATNSISDRFQNSTNNVDINIKYAPSNVSIFYSSDNGDMQEDNGYINITCNADCNPECDRYVIYHNGRRGYQTKEKRIKKDRTNSGLYKCEALNSLNGSVSETINISIRYITVILESNKKELAINISDILPRDVSCRIDCNFPGCDSNITVKRDSQLYRTIRPRESIFENRAVERSDGGTYVCMVGTRVSGNNFKLIIYHGPKTTSVLRNYYQTISGDIIEKEDPSMAIPLRCWSSCNPSCEVAWYKDGQVESRGNPVIEITRYRRMSGVYQCEASGVEGKVKSAQVNVTIQYPPGDVTITPGDDIFYTKVRGKPLHDITCEADCVPECTYTWYREGYRYWYTAGNSLFATRSYYDTGFSRFRCLASNAIEPYHKYSRRITVKVKDGPDNVTIIPSLPAIENRSFTLTCSASCHNGCQSYSWYHNWRSMNQSTKVLRFHRLSKEDSGRYQCNVTDYFGEKSGNYSVNVQYGPKNVTVQYSTYYSTHYPSSYKYLMEKEDFIDITCKADCYLPCTYLIYQNGKLLKNKYIKNKRVYRNMSGRYTCAAKNSIVNTYMNSTNFEDINIKYKPNVSSDVDQTTITAPDLLDLTFSVDSFPSSNVTIFHGKKRLTFLPHVTGQLTYNVSIESCLDRGKYRVKAVNDAGSDIFTLIANVICSPVIVGYSNFSRKRFQVGDSLNYKVDFMANPEAKVSWTFIDWNSKEPKELEKRLIQNLGKSTKVVINSLNLSNFGEYELELKNDLGKIKREFHIQGPPQSPTDLNVDCPRSAIISWRPGFDGGATQDFVIEYSDNSSYWLTHHPQSVVSVDNNFMSAQIHDIRPNIPYSFRIRAKNSFGVAASDTTVNCTWQNYDEMASFLNNRNALVGIGVLVLLLLIVFAVLVALIKLKRRRESNNQDNSLRKQGNNSNEEDNASEIVENILYITADDAKEQVQASVDTPVDTTQNGSDVYAVVEKKPKTDDRDDQPVYTDVCKADQKKKKPAIAAKPSKVKKDERPTVNKDGLIYVDLDLKDTPSTSTEAFVIHGADDRTQYVDIDFTRRADPPRDTDNEKSQNEKEKEKA